MASQGSRACQAAGELGMNLKLLLDLGAGQGVLAKCLLYSLPGFFRAWAVFPQHGVGWKITGDAAVPGPCPGGGELRLRVQLRNSLPRDAAGAEAPGSSS